MSHYQAPVKRVDRGKGHSYVDALNQKMTSPSRVLGDGFPHPAFVHHAGNVTAETAVDRWDELAEMSVSERLKILKAARYQKRDAAARRGTEVHALAEKLVTGEEVSVPDELAGHVDAYTRFLDDFHVEPVAVETVVVSYSHGYAGTLDLIADLACDEGVIRWLLDIKTNASGVYGETALQLASYRYCEYRKAFAQTGEEVDMPTVDRVGVVWVRSDGYSLIPITAGPTQHRQFLYVMQVANFANTCQDLIGDEIAPPTRTEANA